MTTRQNLTTITTSGQIWIDALLDPSGPHWQWSPEAATNTITYSFNDADPAVLTDANADGLNLTSSKISTMTAAQQQNVQSALAQASAVTGINFVQTSAIGPAELHFSLANLGTSRSGDTTGETTYNYPTIYTNGSGQVTSAWTPDVTVFINSAAIADGTLSAALQPGDFGYMTLLHEIGHALGFKHPGNYGSGDVPPYLSSAQDNTTNTVMSYNAPAVGPYDTTYAPFDIAGLQWLYGNDGLAGAGLGPNSTGLWLDGTQNADSLTSPGAGAVVYGQAGNDTVTGYTGSSTGNETLAGNQGDDSIVAGSGNEVVFGGQGNDTIRAGSGADTLAGDLGNDSIVGGGGSNLLLGNAGNDTIQAGGGPTMIYGGQGDDVLYGGAGSDTLSGDKGSDTLYGGTGSDLFLFAPGNGHDIIENFNSAKDHIGVVGGTAYTIATSAQGDAMMVFSVNDDVTLLGVTPSNLQANAANWVVRE